MKTCIECVSEKPDNEFYKDSKSKDGLGRYCKSCMAIKYVSCRNNKKAHYNQVQESRRVGIQVRYNDWKRALGCACCDENEPICLDLHHLDPSIKEGNPSSFTSYSWNKLMKEASKCVVVCRNCHAKIHAGIINI